MSQNQTVEQNAPPAVPVMLSFSSWILFPIRSGAYGASLTLALGIIVSVRAYRIVTGVLVCLLALLAWRYWVQSRQLVWAWFIDAQCRTTQESFIDEPLDPQALALRLDFLIGYYEGHSKVLADSRLKSMVRREYQQTLTNAVAAFRSMTTNDLGDDPRAWIQQYEQENAQPADAPE